VLLIWSVHKPLPAWSPISHWQLQIKWRIPGLRATIRFLKFAGPICFVLLTKVLIYSELFHLPVVLCSSAAFNACSSLFC